MLLAIDIGNSNIVFGVHDRNAWVDRWRIRTVPEKTSAEYGLLFRELLSSSGTELDSIERTIISSVVPQLTQQLQEMAHALFRSEVLVVTQELKTGLVVKTDNPSEVGADLITNAVAAYSMLKSNCIVVDFGTALTFTAVSRTGDILGVAIAPGIRSATEALSTHTAQLPHVSLNAPPAAIGKNTVHSIQSGIIFGYAGFHSRNLAMAETVARREGVNLYRLIVEVMRYGQSNPEEATFKQAALALKR